METFQWLPIILIYIVLHNLSPTNFSKLILGHSLPYQICSSHTGIFSGKAMLFLLSHMLFILPGVFFQPPFIPHFKHHFLRNALLDQRNVTLYYVNFFFALIIFYKYLINLFILSLSLFSHLAVISMKAKDISALLIWCFIQCLAHNWCSKCICGMINIVRGFLLASANFSLT